MITGLLNADVCIVSYGDGTGKGMYEFDPGNYDAFAARCLSAKKDYINPGGPDELFVITKDGEEKRILNTLMEGFPANNDDSSEYAISWVHGHNRAFIISILAGNIPLCLLMGALLMVISRNGRDSARSGLEDLSNHCLDKRTPAVAFTLLVASQSLAVACATLAANAVFSPFAGASFPVLLYNWVLVSIPPAAASLSAIPGRGKTRRGGTA